jgi:hypothetical protein
VHRILRKVLLLAGREPRLRSFFQKQLPLINRRQKKRVEALDEKSD